MMFGYACDETDELMPRRSSLAPLTRALTAVRRSGALPFLRPDGKSQVTVATRNKPARIDAVVVSTQHRRTSALQNAREA
jgi:S-adenosylmethionine synthetase